MDGHARGSADLRADGLGDGVSAVTRRERSRCICALERVDCWCGRVEPGAGVERMRDLDFMAFSLYMAIWISCLLPDLIT